MPDTTFEPFELTAAERDLVGCYETIERVLAEHRDELPPFAQRNAIKALACLWQIANGTGQFPDQIHHTGA